MQNKEWTVMVYMSGNNNLSEEMVSELKGMQAAMKSKNAAETVNLVAVYHSSYFSVETAVYNFTSSNADSRLEECRLQPGPADLGPDPRSPGIQDFVRFVVSKSGLKAKKYALIIAGHSDGIMGKTLLKNNSDESFVSLPRLREILGEAKQALGKNRKFDLLAFDSCLMSMVEIGYELRDVADNMVASQGLIPSSGWPFERVLAPLVSSAGQLTPAEFARSMVDSVAEHNRDFALGGRSVNINASDLTKAANLKNAVDALGQYLGGILAGRSQQASEEDSADTVVRERISDLIHFSRYYSQSFMQEQAVDIIDFAQNLDARSHVMRSEIKLLAGTDLSPASKRLLDVLDGISDRCKAVIEMARSYVFANCYSGPEYQFSTGCSMFFPWTFLAFQLVHKPYGGLQFAGDGSDWRDFIGSYSHQTQRPRNGVLSSEGPKPTELSEKMITASASQGHRIWDARVWDARVWDARVWDARVWDARVWDARVWDARVGDIPTFFKEFGRFRNFDMHHDPTSGTK